MEGGNRTQLSDRRRSGWVSVALTATLLLSGCSLLGSTRVSDQSGSVSVTETGFRTTVAGVTVSGGPGIAPAGSKVAVTETPAPQHAGDAVSSPVVGIAFEGDARPAGALTLDWAVPAGTPGEAVAFVTSAGPEEHWSGVPVTVDADRATATMTGAGRGWFVDGSALRDRFGQGVSEFRTREYADAADCATSVRVGYADFGIENPADSPMQICLTSEDDDLVITLRSQSPYVLGVTPGPGGEITGSGATSPLAEVIRAAAATQAIGDQRGVLLPGDTLTVRLTPEGGNPDLLSFEFDPGLSMIPAAWTGLEEALRVWEARLPEGLPQNAEFVTCLGEATKDAAGEQGDPDATSARFITCFTSAVAGDPAAQLPAAVLDSLTPRIRGSLTGIVADRERLSVGHVTATRRTASMDDVTQYRLEATGLGPVRIGMTKAEVFANGWAKESPECSTWGSSTKLERQGVNLWADQYGRLHEIHVTNPRVRTASGATVGMTVAELRSIYGDRLRAEQRPTSGGDTTIHSVRAGSHEIIFWLGDTRSGDATRVEALIARPYEPGLWSGC